MRIKVFLISFFVFILQHSMIKSQEHALIKGKLTDENNNPLFSASIGLEQIPVGTVSDDRGSFELQVPAGKRITVVFSYLGYKEERLPLNLQPGEIYEINLKLTPYSEKIDDVVVYSQSERANTLVRIDIKSIDHIPNTSGGFESVLKTLPGVSSGNELSSQYSVRGGNFDENLVYVNDIEVYRPFLVRASQQEGLSFINSDMISSIQFSAGGFDAQYGDKMSSVLDIKYHRPTEFGATTTMSLLGASAHVEGISQNNRFTHNSGIRYKTNQYLLGTLDTEGDYKPTFLDIQTFLTYDITKEFEISLLGNYSLNKFKLIPEVRRTDFGTYQQALSLEIEYDGQEIDQFDNYMGAVSFNYNPRENLSLKLIGSAFSSMENVSYDIQGQYWLNQLDNTIGSETQGDSILNIGVGTYLEHARNTLDARILSLAHKGNWFYGKNNFKWGIKYQAETISDRLNEWDYVDSADYSLPYSNSELLLYSSSHTENDQLSSRISAYFQNTFNISLNGSDMFLTLGLRSHYWDYNKQLLISPRGTIFLNPNWVPDITFHFATGYYYQPPFYKELRDPEGNIYDDIKAQKSIHYVIGSNYNFKAWDRPFVFTTELYYKYLYNLIPYKIENVRIQYLPDFFARGYSTGIEFKINGEFVRGIESWASLSIMRTKEDVYKDYYIKRDGTVVVPGYYRRPTDQLINFSLYFQDYLPNNPDYKVHLTLMFGSGLPYESPDYDRPSEIYSLGQYKRVDIGFSKAINRDIANDSPPGVLGRFKDLWVSAEILNLFGVENRASFDWIRTVNNQAGQPNVFAVPNNLTGRRFNVRLTAKF